MLVTGGDDRTVVNEVEGAGVGEVVATDHADCGLDVGVGDGGDERADGAERCSGKRDVVGLPCEWEDSSPRSVIVARSPRAVSAMPEATASATSRWEVSSGPVTVCGSAPAAMSNWSSSTPGAGAGFAPGNAPPDQVGGAGDVVGVSGRDDQALFATPQVQQVRALATQQRSGVGRVVDAGVVAQVDRGAVGLAAGQGAQGVEAAAGSDRDDRRASVAKQDMKGGVVAAGEAEHPVGLQQPARQRLSPSPRPMARSVAAISAPTSRRTRSRVH